jgi:hypothetical protein
MKISKTGKTRADTPTYQWGTLGGRTTHPTDPSGVVFGPTHWPKALPHESTTVATGGNNAGVATPGEIPAPKKPATTTGLVIIGDFINEARTAGVLTTELRQKLMKSWEGPAPNEGMRRMRVNNILRAAIRRKGNGR